MKYVKVICMLCLWSWMAHGAVFTFFYDYTGDGNWNNSDNWSKGQVAGQNSSTEYDQAYVVGARIAHIETPSPDALNLPFDLVLGNTVVGGTVHVLADVPGIDSIRIGDNTSAEGQWYQTAGVVNPGSINIGASSNAMPRMQISGGTLASSSSITLDHSGTFSQRGETTVVSANNFTMNDGATLELVPEGGGFDALDLSGTFTIDADSKLIVAAGAYTGSSSSIDLVQFGGISGAFAASNISIYGLGGNRSGSVVYDGDSMNLEITEFPLQTTIFQGGEWNVGGSWSQGYSPVATNHVYINNGREAHILTNVAERIETVSVGNTATPDTALIIHADLPVNNLRVAIASGSVGAVVQSNGLVNVGRTFKVSANSVSANGSYSISGGELEFPYVTLEVGTTGIGRFNVDGSTSEISGENMILGSQGTVHFNMDTVGVSPIRLAGNLTVESGAQIMVDGADYEGFDGYFPLFEFLRGSDGFDTNCITLTGFEESREPALVVEDDAICVRLVARPAFTDELCSLVPESTVPANYGDAQFSYTRALDPSGSKWGTRLNEAEVMNTRISTAVQNASTNLSWDIRIGRGGQLYSFCTPYLGETVPPSFGGHGVVRSSWMDEVWQAVAVDSAKKTATQANYFIHQAGVYIKDPAQNDTPFYSPQLASKINPEERSFTTINWGQQAHTDLLTDDTTENDFRSDMLYYTRYRDLGDGVIELSLGLYNYGEDHIDHLNLPWGGVRRSRLNFGFLANLDGSWSDAGDGGSVDHKDCGGWFGFSGTSNAVSPSLGIVFGTEEEGWQERQTDDSLIWWLNAGGDPIDGFEEGSRNYKVFCSVRRYKVHEDDGVDEVRGVGVWARYYYVLGDDMTDVKRRIDERALLENTGMFAFDYTEDSTPLVGYRFSGNGNDFQVEAIESDPDFYLYEYPVSGSFPIYEMIEKDQTRHLTWDPYATGVKKTYDGTIAGMRLLGFAMRSEYINRGDGIYRYDALDTVLSAASDNYIASGESLSVRVPLGDGVIGQDDFDGEAIYASRSITGEENSIRSWAIVNRDTVASSYILDTSLYNQDGSAADGSDAAGFLESTDTDSFFAICRSSADAKLTYTFDVSGYSDLRLDMDWVTGEQLNSGEVYVKAWMDSGPTNELFRADKSADNWTLVMESGTNVNFALSVEAFTNGVSAGALSDAWKTYTCPISGEGSVLTVEVNQPNKYQSSLGLDNIKLYGTFGTDGYSSWIAGYDLTGSDAAENANPDDDSFENYEEYIAGLNPTNADSFALSNFMIGGTNAFEWNAVEGRLYNIYWSSNLVDGFELIESNVVDGVYSDPERSGENAGFYKITVELQE